jgi:hypothetical protein
MIVQSWAGSDYPRSLFAESIEFQRELNQICWPTLAANTDLSHKFIDNSGPLLLVMQALFAFQSREKARFP